MVASEQALVTTFSTLTTRHAEFSNVATVREAGNLSDLMIDCHLWAEAKQFLSEQIPLALEALGPDDVETLKMRGRYAIVLGNEGNHTEAVAILEDVAPRCRRIFGNDHPLTAKAQYALGKARERLSHS